MRIVRCENPDCLKANQVRAYRLDEPPPRCGKCQWFLPEPAHMKLLRSLDKAHPIAWITLGVGIVVIGYSFLDQYVLIRGLVGNLIYGKINGLPYRYVFAVGVSLILLGGYLWGRKWIR